MDSILDLILGGAGDTSDRRQRGSVVRVGDLNTENLGSNPQLGLLNEFVLGEPRGKFVMLFNSQLVCFIPVRILNWKRGGF